MAKQYKAADGAAADADSVTGKETAALARISWMKVTNSFTCSLRQSVGGGGCTRGKKQCKLSLLH